MQSDGAGFVQSIHLSIIMAVHDYDYKQGAFKHVITQDLSALEMTNIMLASPLLNDWEKAETSAVRDVLIDYEKDKWANLSPTEILLKTLPTTNFCNIFDKDMEKRGLYVPPMLAQVYDPETGHVTETHTVDNAGNGQFMRGGVPGVVPGAPAEFSVANAKHFADMGFGPKGAKKDQANAGGRTKSEGEHRFLQCQKDSAANF